MDSSEDSIRKKPRLNGTEDQEMKIVDAPSSSPRIIDGTQCICQLLQNNLFFFLDQKTAFSLSLTSNEISKAMHYPISEKIMFHYRKYKPLSFYQPKKLTIHTLEWKGLLALKPSLGKLREITFYDRFNNLVIVSLHKYIPAENITHITFGRDWNHKLGPEFFSNYKNLQNLTFGHDYKESVENLLPETLTHLKFDYFFNSTVNRLPQNLTHLETGYIFNQPVDNLPQTLTHLKLGHNFNRSINRLPKSLKHLVLGHYYNQDVPHLPNGLEYIKFGYNYNQPVRKLPPSLKRIVFGEIFNMPFDTNIPPNLTHVSFGYCFSQPLDALANSKLQDLTLRKGYNYPLRLLPPNVAIHFTNGYREEEN